MLHLRRERLASCLYALVARFDARSHCWRCLLQWYRYLIVAILVLLVSTIGLPGTPFVFRFIQLSLAV